MGADSPRYRTLYVLFGKMDLKSQISEYLDHLAVERGASSNTLDGYRSDLARYRQFCDAASVTELSQVDAGLVGDFLMALRSGADGGSQLSEASSARALVAVRGLHAFALRERWVPVDVAREVNPPAVPERLPEAISVTEVLAVLDAPPKDTPAGLRSRALLELLYGSGCRVSEAVGTDIDDIDLVENTLVVTGKGNKQRMVPIGSHTVTAVQDYLVRARPAAAVKGRGSPALFLNARGGRLSRQSAWSAIRSAGEAAGISDLHPHTMRHSFATHLLQGGADIRVVQELLGHASVTTTQIYTKVTIDHLREVYVGTHPRGR